MVTCALLLWRLAMIEIVFEVLIMPLECSLDGCYMYNLACIFRYGPK